MEISRQNARRSNIVACLHNTLVRKIAMSHMSAVAKEKRETPEAKFQALACAGQTLTGNKHNAALLQH